MSTATPTNAGSLSYLDWKIVEMAREDGRWSLHRDGALVRIARAFFGIEVPGPLANDRLEALRRFAGRAWYWDLLRDRDMSAFLAAGFSTEHARQILAHVAARRGFTSPVQEECLA